MVRLRCSDQSRSPIIASATTEQRMIGAISQPPAFTISNTLVILSEVVDSFLLFIHSLLPYGQRWRYFSRDAHQPEVIGIVHILLL